MNDKPNTPPIYPIHFLNQSDTSDKPAPFKTKIKNLGSTGLEYAVVDTLKSIFDPEIPVNIYDLGLIHKVDINKKNEVEIEMTLTTPGCPVAQTFPQMIQDSIEEIPEITKTTLTLVWTPPWTTDRLSEAIKLQLGLL